MSRSLCHVATLDDAGKRLDAMLADRGCYASRSAAARAVEEGRVLVAGSRSPRSTSSARARPSCTRSRRRSSGAVSGEPIDLDIRYEDDDVIVLSKQVGLVCHPSIDHFDGTLVNAHLPLRKRPPVQRSGRRRQARHRPSPRSGYERLDAGREIGCGGLRAHGGHPRPRRRPALHRARARRHGT